MRQNSDIDPPSPISVLKMNIWCSYSTLMSMVGESTSGRLSEKVTNNILDIAISRDEKNNITFSDNTVSK